MAVLAASLGVRSLAGSDDLFGPASSEGTPVLACLSRAATILPPDSWREGGSIGSSEAATADAGAGSSPMAGQAPSDGGASSRPPLPSPISRNAAGSRLASALQTPGSEPRGSSSATALQTPGSEPRTSDSSPTAPIVDASREEEDFQSAVDKWMGRLQQQGDSPAVQAEARTPQIVPAWSVAQFKAADEARRRGEEVFVADNKLLKAKTAGLGLRNSMVLVDMDKERSVIPWGTLVSGLPVGDDWVQVGERFLPRKLEGATVLQPAERNDGEEAVAAAPDLQRAAWGPPISPPVSPAAASFAAAASSAAAAVVAVTGQAEGLEEAAASAPPPSSQMAAEGAHENSSRKPDTQRVENLTETSSETRSELSSKRRSSADYGEECRLLRAELHAARERLSRLQDIVDNGQQDGALSLRIKDLTIERLQQKLLDQREQAEKDQQQAEVAKQELLREFAREREQLNQELEREKARRRGLQLQLEEADAVSPRAGRALQSPSGEEPLSPFALSEQTSPPPEPQSLRSSLPSGRDPSNGPSRRAGREPSNGASHRSASDQSNAGLLRTKVVPMSLDQINARPAAQTRSISREQPRSGQSMAKQDGQVAVDMGLSLSDTCRTSHRLVPSTAIAAIGATPPASAAVTAVRLSSASPTTYVRQASCSPVSTSRTASPTTLVRTASTVPLPAPRMVVPTSVFSSVVAMTCQVGSARRHGSPIRTRGPPGCTVAPVAMQSTRDGLAKLGYVAPLKPLKDH